MSVPVTRIRFCHTRSFPLVLSTVMKSSAVHICPYAGEELSMVYANDDRYRCCFVVPAACIAERDSSSVFIGLCSGWLGR